MNLSPEAFQKAKAFLYTKARDLEKKLFIFHFEGGSKKAALEALALFQNEDGGFGNALEPDFRLPDSSPMATTMAFQVLRELEVPAEHALVKKGIAYLLTTYEEKLGRWRQTSDQVNQYPHAPWWHVEKAPQKGFTANCSAEIVGHLLHYRECVPSEFAKEMEERALDHLATLPDTMAMHDCLCYLHLHDAQSISSSAKQTVRDKLFRAAPLIVTKDPQKWFAYSCKPLWLAPYKSSLLAELLKEDVERNLDFEIRNQNKNGAWLPFWTWGESYPEVWEKAKAEWSGHLTLTILKSLKDFDRID